MPTTSSTSPAADGFDVDAWLSEAAPPTRSVTLYGRGDLVARLQDLTARRKVLAEQASTVPDGAGRPVHVVDQRLGGDDLVDVTPADLELAALDAEVAEVREMLEQSARTFHIRGVMQRERDELVAKHTSKKRNGETGKPEDVFDQWSYSYDIIAAAMVAPTLTPEQASRLHQRVGDAQWAELGRALEDASSETIDVPLSQLG